MGGLFKEEIDFVSHFSQLAQGGGVRGGGKDYSVQLKPGYLNLFFTRFLHAGSRTHHWSEKALENFCSASLT